MSKIVFLNTWCSLRLQSIGTDIPNTCFITVCSWSIIKRIDETPWERRRPILCSIRYVHLYPNKIKCSFLDTRLKRYTFQLFLYSLIPFEIRNILGIPFLTYTTVSIAEGKPLLVLQLELVSATVVLGNTSTRLLCALLSYL